jgi:SAM-dependent methyltransferase
VGLDIVPNIIKRAHRFSKTKGSEAQFVIGDVTHLPFRNRSLDGVVSLGVIEHFRLLDEAFQALRESHRVLKNGGKAFFSVPNVFVPLRNRFVLFFSRGTWGMYHSVYTVDALTEMIRLSGFASIHVDVVDLWLPIFFLINGLLKNLGVDSRVRLKVGFYLTRLPHISFLEMFLGYINGTAKKVRATWIDEHRQGL